MCEKCRDSIDNIMIDNIMKLETVFNTESTACVWVQKSSPWAHWWKMEGSGCQGTEGERCRQDPDLENTRGKQCRLENNKLQKIG